MDNVFRSFILSFNQKSDKQRIVLAVRLTARHALQDKFPRAFPKLPFRRRPRDPVGVETDGNVSPVSRAVALVKKGECEARIDRPRKNVVVFTHNYLRIKKRDC